MAESPVWAWGCGPGTRHPCVRPCCGQSSALQRGSEHWGPSPRDWGPPASWLRKEGGLQGRVLGGLQPKCYPKGAFAPLPPYLVKDINVNLLPSYLTLNSSWQLPVLRRELHTEGPPQGSISSHSLASGFSPGGRRTGSCPSHRRGLAPQFLAVFLQEGLWDPRHFIPLLQIWRIRESSQGTLEAIPPPVPGFHQESVALARRQGLSPSLGRVLQGR